MGWETSDRRSRLPANWDALKASVLKRDGHRCTFRFPNGGRCPVREGLEVDHAERGDDHRESNLRTLCNRHHAMKTAQEGHQAKAAKRAAVHKKFRRSEPHPGLRV